MLTETQYYQVLKDVWSDKARQASADARRNRSSKKITPKTGSVVLKMLGKKGDRVFVVSVGGDKYDVSHSYSAGEKRIVRTLSGGRGLSKSVAIHKARKHFRSLYNSQ